MFLCLRLQQVMKDKWINSGYEGEELKPHIEPVEDYSDPARIGESASSQYCCRRLVGSPAKRSRSSLVKTDDCLFLAVIFGCFSEVMVGMGFTPEEIKDSLLNQKYNEVTATYLLLGRKGDVSSYIYGPLFFI